MMCDSSFQDGGYSDNGRVHSDTSQDDDYSEPSD